MVDVVRMWNRNSSMSHNWNFELVTDDQAKLTFVGGPYMTAMLADGEDDHMIDFDFAFVAVQDQVLTPHVLATEARLPYHGWGVPI